MIVHLLKEKSILLVLFFLICSIPAFADEDKTSKENVKDAEHYFNQGYDLAELDKHQEAVDAFKQVIRIKPDFAEAHYNLGVAYIILKYKGSAHDEYKILKDLNKELANKLFNEIYP